MLKKFTFSSRVTFVLKSLLVSYLLTAGLLLLLSLLLYRFSLSERVVSVSITGIYIVVTFLAGFIAGKREGSRKFLWGLMMGILYFLVLAMVSIGVNRGISAFSMNFLTVLALCSGSGMLGGMLS